MRRNTFFNSLKVLLMASAAVICGGAAEAQPIASVQESPALSAVQGVVYELNIDSMASPNLYAAAAKKSSESKSVKKTDSKKTSEKKSSTKKSTTKKSTAKKSTAKKATAKKAPAPKKSSGGGKSIKMIIEQKTAEKKKNAAASGITAAAVQAQDVPAPSGAWIKIIKSEHRLYVMDGDSAIKSYPIAVGTNLGQKQQPGDRRTPEGDFEVQQVQNASSWTHDFKDGKGVIQGAYGPWFIRLKTPWSGIGIHGTHDPNSIGNNVTEGCIRLHNSDLMELKSSYIRTGMKVVIE